MLHNIYFSAMVTIVSTSLTKNLELLHVGVEGFNAIQHYVVTE